MGEFDNYLKRRMLGSGGWTYFCRICGQYKLETEFYTRNSEPFRIDTKCKLHYTKKDKNDNGEMDHIKFNPLKQSDFVATQKFLETLGYKFGIGEEPVHIQFNKKHNLDG
jgi:hypothetical protein